MKIDFNELKAKTPIENVVLFLGLQMKRTEPDQLRGDCPVCSKKAGDRHLSVNIHEGVFRCFSSGAKGSVLDLVMHVRNLSLREAGVFIQENINSPVPEKKKEAPPKAEASPTTFDPEAYAKSLSAGDPLIEKLGLDPEVCTQFQMGVPAKGVHKGRFTFPIRDASGRIAFFASATDFKMPKKLK